MITCKEDLINTYIENDFGELRDLYLAKCERFGLMINSACYTTRSEVIFTKLPKGQFGNVDHSWPDIAYIVEHFGEMKKLTLSDLKPVKQYAVLHKGGSYSFQSDKPIGDDVVACFDLANSERPLSEGFFDEKPRTKVEYVKVDESIFDLRDEFERGELVSKVGEKVAKLESEKHFVTQYSFGYIHRKIEKEIDERQEFIDAAFSVIEDYHGERRQYVVEALYDSGKFKLVN